MEKDTLAPDRLGVIPGVESTSKELIDKLATLKKFDTYLNELYAQGKVFEIENLKYDSTCRISEKELAECLLPATERYDFTLTDLPGFYSSQELGLFLGGMAFEFSDDKGMIEKDKHFTVFQLRDAFRKKNKFLLYTREELISHEACHAARMALNSTRYEELIAYRLSPSKFRQHFGSIFNSSSIMIALTITFFVFMASQVATIFQYPNLILIWGGKIPFIFTILYLLYKNNITHRVFDTAKDNLSLLFGDKAEAVLFRLSDEEIDSLGIAKLSSSDVEEKLSQMSELRRDMIFRYRTDKNVKYH